MSNLIYTHTISIIRLANCLKLDNIQNWWPYRKEIAYMVGGRVNSVYFWKDISK